MINRRRFEHIYKDTYRNLLLYVRSLLRGTSRVEDTVQEAYLRLIKSAPDSLSDKKLRSYLYTTATNLARDIWRRDGMAEEWRSGRNVESRESAEWDSGPERLDILKALSSLSNMERALIWLAYGEGYKHREIADILGIKEQSVRVLLFRARKSFISKYGEINSIVERKGSWRSCALSKRKSLRQ